MLRNDTIETAKKALRQQVRGKLNKMTPEERAAASLQACSRLEEQTVWQKAQSILFYAPMPEEVDIWRLLADAHTAGKTILLPRYNAEEKAYVVCHVADAVKDLRKGQFGVR